MDHDRLFERSPIPTMRVDLERRAILESNEAATQLLGTDGTVPPSVVAELLDEPDDDLAVNGSVTDSPIRGVRRIGTNRGVRSVEVSVLPPGPDGAAFVLLHDVTDLLNANAALLRHTVDLEARSAALETVGARIAHDLRGPLATIAGFVDLLRDAGADMAAEQRSMILDRVHANAQVLATTVTEMLDEAKQSVGADAGSTAVDTLFARLHEVFESYDVDDTTLDTVSTVADLPVPVGAIRQVLVNLVDNSIKFRRSGHPLHVRVEVEEVDGRTVVSVIDDGSGIEGDPEALFESGARGVNAATVEGSGLGLAFARRTVETIGGTLTAEAGDPGAVFRVVLPEASAMVSEAATEAFAGGLTAFQLDRILEVAPVPMLLADLTQRTVIRVNAAAAAALGLPNGAIVGQPVRDFVQDPGAPGRLMASGSGAATPTEVIAGDRRLPALVWMVGFDDSALLVVQFPVG